MVRSETGTGARSTGDLPAARQVCPRVETLPLDPSAPDANRGCAAPSFEALYASQRLPMVRLAVLLVDDLPTAEDVVQDAFTGLHRQWSRLRDQHAAVGYLHQAVVNGSRSVLRRRRTVRRYVPPAPVPEASADAPVLLAEEHRHLLEAVTRLPRRQREVVVLRYWSELAEADIATALGISPGTVKSTASRALDRLESLLAPA